MRTQFSRGDVRYSKLLKRFGRGLLPINKKKHLHQLAELELVSNGGARPLPKIVLQCAIRPRPLPPPSARRRPPASRPGRPTAGRPLIQASRTRRGGAATACSRG